MALGMEIVSYSEPTLNHMCEIMHWSSFPMEGVPPRSYGAGHQVSTLLSCNDSKQLLPNRIPGHHALKLQSNAVAPTQHVAANPEACGVVQVAERTSADKKGGHLCKRSSDGRLLLRESAMVRDQDKKAFEDITK